MRRFLISLLALGAAGGPALGQGGLIVWTTLNDQSFAWLQVQLAEFSELFGIETEVVQLSLGDVQLQMIQGAEEGEAADILVGIPHDQVGSMAEREVLADLTGFATDSYLADLSEPARLAFILGGSLVGLPLFVEGPALIVNTDLVPDVPETYEALIALAQELTTDETWGFLCDCLGNFYFAYNWIHSTGGFVFDRGSDGSLLPDMLGVANDGAVRGAENLKALRYEYELMPTDIGYERANSLFVDGAVAMIYNGPWAISHYRAAGINLAVVPIPSFADGTVSSGFMGVQGVLMNQFSSDTTNAANLAKWLVRSDAQISLATVSGRIPASLAALAAVGDNPFIAGFGQALLTAEPLPNIPEMGSIWGPMGRALRDIFETVDSDVSDILRNAQDQILGD